MRDPSGLNVTSAAPSSGLIARPCSRASYRQIRMPPETLNRATSSPLGLNADQYTWSLLSNTSICSPVVAFHTLLTFLWLAVETSRVPSSLKERLLILPSSARHDVSSRSWLPSQSHSLIEPSLLAVAIR